MDGSIVRRPKEMRSVYGEICFLNSAGFKLVFDGLYEHAIGGSSGEWEAPNGRQRAGND